MKCSFALRFFICCHWTRNFTTLGLVSCPAFYSLWYCLHPGIWMKNWEVRKSRNSKIFCAQQNQGIPQFSISSVPKLCPSLIAICEIVLYDWLWAMMMMIYVNYCDKNYYLFSFMKNVNPPFIHPRIIIYDLTWSHMFFFVDF